MAASDPVPPFDATVALVAMLLPDATIPDQAAAGQRAVNKDTVHQWIADVTTDVLLAIPRWDELSEDRRDTVMARARAIIATGAAAITEAARTPERAGKVDESYANELRVRYQRDLESLRSTVTTWLNEDTATAAAKTAAAAFPAATIVDRMAW